MKDSVLSEFFDEIEYSRTKPDYFEEYGMGVSKVIRGFPDYEIYEDGSVWSTKTGAFLVPSVSGNVKYPKVNLYRKGGKRTSPIHKMVAEAFIPKPKHPDFKREEWRALPLKARKIIQSEFQVDHIDGDPGNYHVSNLRWATGKENRDYYHTEQKYLK